MRSIRLKAVSALCKVATPIEIDIDHCILGPIHAPPNATVTIRNTTGHPTPAFFTRADVRRGTARGGAASGDNQVLPIQWSQNDVTLWPGQSQTLTARYRATDLHGARPVVSIGGWNVAPQAVSAG